MYAVQRHLSLKTQSWLRRSEWSLKQTDIYTVEKVHAWELGIPDYLWHERAWFAVSVHDYRVPEAVMLHVPDANELTLFSKAVHEEVSWVMHCFRPRRLHTYECLLLFGPG